jgi:N6-L-threonylcarbamoyladenine synthase
MNQTPLHILGIETSCDETAAAVYSTTAGVMSNVLFSQIEIHRAFGGVVPEVASRSHVEKINGIIEQALTQANVHLDIIDAIAVTNKPGLPGSLLVGVCFAKAVAWAKEKHLIGVNHLEAHVFSSCIENQIPFPHLCIAASGGHTSLYLVKDFGSYECIGHTRDDAAGEAFDKVAKMLNLPYPGGPVIERLAQEVNFEDFFKYPRPKHLELDLSFSGLKTAVLYDLVARSAYDLASKKLLDDSLELKQKVASSLLVCVRDMMTRAIEKALNKHPEIAAVTFVGGVACNSYLKEALRTTSQKHDKPFFAPAPKYCGDNGAMIAFVGHYKAQRQEYSDLFLDILHG